MEIERGKFTKVFKLNAIELSFYRNYIKGLP